MCKQKIMQEFSGEVKLIGVIFLLRRMNEKAVNSGGGKRKKIRRVNFLFERGGKRRQEEARGSKRKEEEARGGKRRQEEARGSERRLEEARGSERRRTIC